jgi:hypothetical protein
MYPSTTLFIAVGQLAIAILVMFSYPLQVHPCRNSLDKVFHVNASPRKIAHEGDDEDDEIIDDHGSGEMSPFKHTVLTAAVIVSGFSIAYFVDDLQMGEFNQVRIHWRLRVNLLVLSFVGSTGSTTVSFILPGLFFWKASVRTSLGSRG